MPFTQFFPRSFEPGAIHTYAPNTSGVYGISNAEEWILIGESDDIRSALLSHLQESHTPLMDRHPTGFVFETCDRVNRTTRKDRLVSEYAPTCNGHAPARRSSRYA